MRTGGGGGGQISIQSARQSCVYIRLFDENNGISTDCDTTTRIQWKEQSY